ncbi:MAG: hypothetical protein WA154_12925 [Moraxellaceae bacterium]
MRPSVYPCPLDWQRITHLAPLIVEEDKGECRVSGLDPLQALTFGAMDVYSKCVVRFDTDTPVGAFGMTTAGSIWSLWGKLTPRESFQVLHEMPRWVHDMVLYSTRTLHRPLLHNHVACSNARAIAWLRLSKCFWIDPTEVDVRGVPHHYFETLPLHLLQERLAHV